MKVNNCTKCRHFLYKDNRYCCGRGHNYDGIFRTAFTSEIQIECQDFEYLPKEEYDIKEVAK